MMTIINYHPFLTRLMNFQTHAQGVSPNPFQLNGLSPQALQAQQNIQGTYIPPQSDTQRFQDMLADTLGQVNHTLQEPDHLLKRSLMGGEVDIHEIMIANSKAELSVNIASQTITKAVQAYDRILQIQV
ncbi:MAG: flagellar hook-basal body complex protein FliE [Vampirovibrionales bacterium]